MNGRQPDVTFVIAAYNAEAFVAHAIESALAEAEGPKGVAVEIVVADDRSSDRTVAVAERYAARSVRVVCLGENSGPGGARNAALACASGRWLAVLDADDAVVRGRTARLIARAEAASADIVMDNLSVVQGEGEEGRPMFPHAFLSAHETIDLARFIQSNRIFAGRYNFGYMKPMIRRAFVERHGLAYDPALRVGEDYLFMAEALACGGVCAIEPEPGYAYRVREGSISHVLDPRHVSALQRADEAFAARHALDGPARAALRAHRRSLDQAASFLALVGHIKDRNAGKALATALGDPLALRHLAMPIAARMRRLAAHMPVPRLT